MKVSQYFTGRGVLGVVLFMVGNIASAGFLASWMTESPGYPPSIMSYVLGGICGFATLVSIPMMLIGREYEVTGFPPSSP